MRDDQELAAGLPQDSRDGLFRHEVLAVVLQVRHRSLSVLLWQRGEEPFAGRWALPGGPLAATERLGTSLGRHLAAKVDLTDIAHLEQLETRSDPARDPRGRVLGTAYLALVRSGIEPRIPGCSVVRPRSGAGIGPPSFGSGNRYIWSTIASCICRRSGSRKK